MNKAVYMKLKKIAKKEFQKNMEAIDRVWELVKNGFVSASAITDALEKQLQGKPVSGKKRGRPRKAETGSKKLPPVQKIPKKRGRPAKIKRRRQKIELIPHDTPAETV